MRTAIILSLIAHVAVLQWVLYMLPSANPVEISSIEALPVDLVPIGEITDIAKGQDTPKPEPEPDTAKLQPEEAPTPAPEPPPPPPPPPLPEHVIAPPEPEPPPVPEPEVAPQPPEEVVAPLESEPTPPPPEPQAAPEPPPPPVEETVAPPPPPLPEHVIAPPPREEPKPEPELAMAPVPKSRPRPPPPPAADDAPLPSELSDRIQALLDKNRELPPQETQTASLGTRIVQCWSPPLGATGADELRTVVLIRLNRDGSLNGQPQIVSRPPGRYETTAPESVVRAIGRCAPYNLPLEKYAEWREIEFDFYPVDMF